MSSRSIVPAFAFIVGLAGCGGPAFKTVPLERVGGVVTFDGKPLEKAVVVFESPDGSFSYGLTDSRGRYDLYFDSKTRGVTHGEKIVRIATNRRLKGLNANDEGGPQDRAGGAIPKQLAERIPEQYNARSTLVVRIDSKSRTFDFDLHR
jgi:hypothetical protein